MSSKEMPLILDNDIPMQLAGVGDVGDVDDLFGDTATLPLQAPSHQLDQRMNLLKNRACCQTIAWSRVGTIASVTPDGQELELRFLRCRPVDGEWELGEPTTCSLVRGTPEHPLVHLEWAGTNNPELAIFDAGGRVTLLIFSTTLTHPFIVKKWDADAVDEMQSLAGCYWLPVTPSAPINSSVAAPAGNRQSYNVLFGPANKGPNGSYQYESSFMHAEAPSHPLPARTALLTVSMGGVLKMLWMQMNNKLEETVLELERVSVLDDMVTHAAFAAEKKHLVLVLATAAKQLKLIKVEIQWSAQPGKTGGAQNARFSVVLTEKHLATTSWCVDSEDASGSHLSHLLALPSMLDNTGKNMVPPLVITVRSRAQSSGSFSAHQTVIDRWEAVEVRHHLHPAIEQLGNRRNSTASESTPGVFLRPLEPTVLPKTVISIQSAQFGKIIILTFSDGSVEYRDRFTFQELFTEQDVSVVSNLRQFGWTFAADGPCYQVAYSPTLCSMVVAGEDGKLRWRKISYSEEDFGNAMKDPLYAASMAGLTITAATAIKYQANFDDMLAIVRPYSGKKRLVQDWLHELVRILNIQVDYSGEHSHDALLKNEQMRSCLSIQISFGFKGDMQPRSFQSTYALAAVSIRSQAWNITIATSPHFQVGGKKSPLDDYEVVDTLVSSVRWSLDLIAWISDCLFGLMNDDEFMQRLTPQRASELASFLHAKNDVSLQLLLCSSSRSFLVALCRRVAHLDALSKKAIEFYRRHSASLDPNAVGKAPNPHLRQSYQRLQQLSSLALVNIVEFEKLVNTLGSGIMQTYDKALPDIVKRQPNAPQGKQEDEAVKSARTHMESMMLLAAAPPPPLLLVIKRFFTVDVPAFRKTVDPAKLFFAVFDILDIREDRRSNDGVKAEHLDTFTKAKLKMGPTQQWRRCTRCASVMEELNPKSPGLTFMVNQQRRCPCSGTWAVLAPGKLA